MLIIQIIKDILKTIIYKEKSPKMNGKKCYIMMAADYGNLGDIAITIAQKKFIEENLSEYNVIEVPLDKVYAWANDIRKKLNSDDIITIIGGGNSGDVYDSFEKARQFIAYYYKKYKVISFPQTVDFTNTTTGKKELIIAKSIYKKTNIIFFAREEKSFKFYKNEFEYNESYLVPDIVLSMNRKENNNRNGVILCFRDDKEKNTNLNAKEEIVGILKKKRYEYIYQDTYIGDVKIDQDKDKVLNDILNAFSSKKLVITDRLHGMIFCAITGTPCIAFNNSNGKIENTYKKWLKNFQQINFVENYDVNIIEKIIDELYNSNCYSIKTRILDKNYSQLIRILKNDC